MIINRNKTIELLAPAGSFSCFMAAIKAGADAVYLGMSRFGARANAINFSLEELIKAITIAHTYGRRVYLTVNTLFKEDEIYELYDFLLEPYKAGLDGIIVQDLGVVAFVRKYFPLMEVHASTQMTITDSLGVRFARDLGVNRVVPARELTLNEIKKIHDETGMELECFVHGALCYSYSGKCLFSSCIGERSGNRGSCAGPCRLRYDDEYLLSMKDLCTLRLIPKLIEAGIYSFKIEGRMKSADYVYGVTSIYRKYIDEYLRCGFVSIDKEDEKRLLALYTREGNCEGYYFKKNGKDMITFNSPSYSSSAMNDKDKEDITFCPESIKLDITALIELNKKPELIITINDDSSIYDKESVSINGENVVAKAINAPISKENVIKQLSKLGDTCFRVNNINIILDNGIFISNGELNNLRRQAISLLVTKINSLYVREELINNDFSKEDNKNKSSEFNFIQQVKASVIDEVQLNEVLEYDYITDVIINYSLLVYLVENSNSSILSLISKSKKGIYIRMPIIVRDEKRSASSKKIYESIQGVLTYIRNNYNLSVQGYYISSLDLLELFREKKIEGELIGDIHLYAYNHLARQVLLDNGISNTTVPFEETKAEILRRNVYNEELIVYGKMPMMISTQCIYNTRGKCNYNAKGNKTYINDRRKEKLFCFSDCAFCTSVIFNSVPLSITDEGEYIKKIKPKCIRFDFTDEDNHKIRDILGRFKETVDSSYDKFVKVTDIYTKGHLKKGVL